MDAFGALFATVCSSWVAINSFTSQRTLLIPEGDTDKRYIRDANRMASRFFDHDSFMCTWSSFTKYTIWLYILYYSIKLIMYIQVYDVPYYTVYPSQLTIPQVCAPFGARRSLWRKLAPWTTTFFAHGSVFPYAMVLQSIESNLTYL